MSYKPFIKVDVRHNYYAGGLCDDLIIEPLPETLKALQNHRTILKAGSNGLTLYIEFDDQDQATIPWADGSILTFSLKAKQSQFELVTDFAPWNQFSSLLFVEDPQTLGKTHNGVRSLIASQGDFKLNYDEFARIEITVPAVVPNQPDHFRLQISALNAYWQYYLVTNSPEEDHTYTLQHTITGDEASPDWERKPQGEFSEDSVTQQLQRLHPDCEIIHFQTTTKIHLKEDRRSNVQLFLGDDSLKSYLPTPPAKNFKTVPISENGQTVQHAARYQVIKYITQPLTTNGI